MNWTRAAMEISGAEDVETANEVLTECTRFPHGTREEIIEDLEQVARDFDHGDPIAMFRSRVAKVIREQDEREEWTGERCAC